MQCSRVRDEVLAADKMDVLYGEADAEVRDRVSRHLDECEACREEMRTLRGVRRRLAAWTREDRGLRPIGSIRPALPRWLLAAAVVVLGVGTGVALHGQHALRLELESQREQALAREQAHQQELASLRTSLTREVGAAEQPDVLASIDERVKTLLEESEGRQDRKLTRSLAEWRAYNEAQRRVDLARVAAGLSYLDGRHGQQLARTNELMGYVLENAEEKRTPR